MFQALPWLLLATVTRSHARSIHSAANIPVFFLAEVAVFLALLIATQNQIRVTGGITKLNHLQFGDQLRLAWSVLWRIKLFFLLVCIAMLKIGFDQLSSFAPRSGFDGIVYYWPFPWIALWSGFAAALVFLAIVERGMDRKPTGRAVIVQFFKRFRFVGPAVAAIAIFLFVMGVAQVEAYTLLFPYYDLLDPGPLRNLIATGFILAFGYIRLLVTVYILTHAIRASYRHSSLP